MKPIYNELKNQMSRINPDDPEQVCGMVNVISTMYFDDAITEEQNNDLMQELSVLCGLV